ncbi:MAG: multidrug effflux MFS transporter [Rhodocyclaceae bacterium]|nr:multidrug effflux MFS transporter [Rhodocyclaceae bacterium]
MGLVVLLASLSTIGPFSIDTYLPAFPAMARALGATDIEVQQTLTAYMLPFAFMMLWHGALSDALGRRRVILGGLLLYVLSTLVCVFAQRIEVLWAGRALQGLCAGAGMVVSRAVVRDLFDGAAAQKLMSHIAVLFGIAPAIAPIIGGWIHAWFDWHGIFVFLAVLGAAIFLAAWFLLPETLPPAKRQSLHPVQLWHAYVRVFTHRVFVRLSLALALCFNGMFLYVLSAPVFLMRHLGLSAQAFGWMFGPSVVGLMTGSWVSGRLAGKVSPRRTVALGIALMMAAALANLLLNATVPPRFPWPLLPLPLYTLGLAMTMPALQLMALDHFPERRGLASSCQSVVHTGTNVLTAAVLAPLLWGSTLDLALGMGASLALGILAFALSEPRSRPA